MAGSREIRNKIKSVKNTQKITRAMEMVAASKMRKAQERMRKARPYGDKIRNVAAHMSRAYTEYRHPFLVERDTVKRIGIVVVTSDKGLCGGLNTNVLRMAVNKMKAWEAEGEQIEVCCIGNKGFGLMNRLGASVISHVVNLGDTPRSGKIDRCGKSAAGRVYPGSLRSCLHFLHPFCKYNEARACHGTAAPAF